MKIIRYKKPEIKGSLVLSLERKGDYRFYYRFRDSHGRQLFLMEEFIYYRKPDFYTIFQTWEDIVGDLKQFEKYLGTDKRWWSHCPGWMYFIPTFIHDDLKAYFSNSIIESLECLTERDVIKDERKKFELWVKACNLIPECSEYQHE